MKKLLLCLSALVAFQGICARDAKRELKRATEKPQDFEELFNSIDIPQQEAPAVKTSQKKETIVLDLIKQYEIDKINEAHLITCITTGAICGQELDTRDPKTGKALIHLAAEKGNSKLVSLIIESGGNVSLRTRTNETAEQIIKRKMVAVTTYNSDDKRAFKQYSSCLSSYEKANKRVIAENKKAAKERKKELLKAIDL